MKILIDNNQGKILFNDCLYICLAWLLTSVLMIQSVMAEDLIEIQLEQAKEEYYLAQEEYRSDVKAFLERREETARRSGNKLVVDRIKREQQDFEEKGTPPASLSASIISRRDKARSALERAYQNAIKEYIKSSQDDRAEAVEKEWNAILKGVFIPKDATEFQGKYYKVFEEQQTWHNAKKKCESLGGHLAVISSKEQDQFIFLLAQKRDVQEVYLGATDEAKEGVWLWVSGEKMSYQNWGPLQPTNSHGNEHYLALRIKSSRPEYIGKWNDLPDDRFRDLKVGYVCQWD